MALDVQCPEVVERLVTPFVVEPSTQCVAAERARYLVVEEVRGMDLFITSRLLGRSASLVSSWRR